MVYLRCRQGAEAVLPEGLVPGELNLSHLPLLEGYDTLPEGIGKRVLYRIGVRSLVVAVEVVGVFLALVLRNNSCQGP